MKWLTKIIFVLSMICIPNMVFALNVTEAICKADDLVKNNQYDSAFKLLNALDPENENPEIVLKKVEIILNGYVVSNMHLTFGLQDLKKNETIQQLRGKPGICTYYKFEVSAILEELIKKHPTNFELYRMLGEYYYDAYLNYDENFTKSKNEILELAWQYYDKAEQNNYFSTRSLYALGFIQLRKKNPEKAIIYFLKLLKIEDNANTYFALGNAYLELGNADEGLKYAINSLNHYEDKARKSDAAYLVGLLYRSKKDYINAIKYFKMSEELSPNHHDSLVVLLELYIKTNDLQSASNTADYLFSLEATRFLSASDILLIYSKNGYNDELLKFFERMECKYKEKDDIMGNLLFTKAYYFENIKDWDQAKHYYEEARKFYEKCFTLEQQIFRLIDQRIQSMEMEIEFEKNVGKRPR